jgi:hypothetical protein
MVEEFTFWDYVRYQIENGPRYEVSASDVFSGMLGALAAVWAVGLVHLL